MRNFTLNGQVVAFDGASNEWRVYDPATQTLGATAAAPAAGTTFNADLPTPAPSLVLNNAQPNQQGGNQGQRPQQRPTGQPGEKTFGRRFGEAAAVVALVVVAILAVTGGFVFFTGKTQQANLAPPSANQQVAAPDSDPIKDRPWFEVGGRMPSTEMQSRAQAQGYVVEKGKANDSGCKVVDTPQGKVNRCPNSWTKR